MHVFPGRKKDTRIYIYDGYLYYLDKRFDNVFRCNSRRITKCPGCIALQENNNVTLLKEHNHPKLPLLIAQIEMKEKMLRLSRETHIGLKEIFDSVCRRLFCRRKLFSLF